MSLLSVKGIFLRVVLIENKWKKTSLRREERERRRKEGRRLMERETLHVSIKQLRAA